MGLLPEHLQETAILVLRERYDLSYRDIAELLDLHLEVVRSKLFQARERSAAPAPAPVIWQAPARRTTLERWAQGLDIDQALRLAQAVGSLPRARRPGKA